MSAFQDFLTNVKKGMQSSQEPEKPDDKDKLKKTKTDEQAKQVNCEADLPTCTSGEEICISHVSWDEKFGWRLLIPKQTFFVCYLLCGRLKVHKEHHLIS